MTRKDDFLPSSCWNTPTTVEDDDDVADVGTVLSDESAVDVALSSLVK